MKDDWPDDNAKPESLDIDEILGSEPTQTPSVSRASDRTHTASRMAAVPSQRVPEVPLIPPAEPKPLPVDKIAKFLTILGAAIIVLFLIGTILELIHWIVSIF